MADNTANPKSSDRRNFLKIGGGVVGGFVVGAAAAYVAKPSTTNTSTVLSTVSGGTTTLTSTVPPSTVTSTGVGPTLTATETVTTTLPGSTSTSTVTSTVTASSTTNPLQIQLDTMLGFLTLNTTEQVEVEAIAEALIPTDSNGPGAKEAGVIYFIDRQLATDYGKDAFMYKKPPYVFPNQAASITVNSSSGTPITYSGGSMIATPFSGTAYQYGTVHRDFWRYGLEAFETYCNTAYGGNFETLTSANQVMALTDLANNKPTSFNDIVPSDFFNELFFMTWSGFLTDPLYGGNQNMVGWQLTAFNGVNMGNFYGEGYTEQQLMVASTPTQLQPASLAQFQKGSP